METQVVESHLNVQALQHIKFEQLSNEYIAILVDPQGFEILKGYGNSKEDALNDLHHNLI